ncbi:1-acyl-sn-glycerol-3-phosphate acyltransferase [Candidatus Woesearchaeota archaeon]|nr:1-acyl-sn-glycerol-3-phosphate acyltransferase [Candidatus Woesearchaeota archaeon]
MAETDDLVKRILAVEKDFRLPRNGPLSWDHLTSVDVSPKSKRQRLVTYPTLGLNFWLLPGLDIQIIGLDKLIDDQQYIFAMNHTDSFNYLPFTYKLLRSGKNATVWIKGKNYRHWIGRKFFDAMGMIPVLPTNYLLHQMYARCFSSSTNDHKVLTDTEYRLLKDVFECKTTSDDALRKSSRPELAYMLVRMDEIRFYHDQLMQQVGRLTFQALQEYGLSLLIFPEGTRNIRLDEARIGLAQVALRTEVPVVPVSCSGGPEIYPGKNPFAKKGRITYVIGDPLTVDGALQPYAVSDSLPLLSRVSTEAHRTQFEGATKLIMQRIHDGLDDRHRNVELYH